MFVTRIEMVSPRSGTGLGAFVEFHEEIRCLETGRTQPHRPRPLTHNAVEIATDIRKNVMMRKFNELNRIKAMARMQRARPK